MHGTSLQLCEIEAIAGFVQAMQPAADVLICPPATLVARAATLLQRGVLTAQWRSAAVASVHPSPRTRFPAYGLV